MHAIHCITGEVQKRQASEKLAASKLRMSQIHEKVRREYRSTAHVLRHKRLARLSDVREVRL